eukprot:GGOE01035872.1.p1 GENE.GGOE01035872.1~~GGOE01035872.1.p1  ORF type:complete len:1181 (-),score=400.45 GGOE01035872.1:1169-4495(-)
MSATECEEDDTEEPLAVDFATTSSIPTAEEYEKYPDLQLYPIVAVSIVPIYNLGNVSAQLQLSVSTLARIFTGEIATWDDAAISATNPSFADWGLPQGQPITVVISSASLGTTEIFKKSLATFYSEFEDIAGPSDSPFWGNVTVVDVEETDELQTYVLLHPYSIGFCFLRDAVLGELPIPKLIKESGHMVEANISSLGYAVLELGLNFGNNGESAERLTADLGGALGSHAWPIAGYIYLVMRKNSLRDGATCDNVRATVNFFYWFWTASGSEEIAERSYSTSLPALVQQEVLARFVSDIRCNGVLVYEVADAVQIRGTGLSLLDSSMQLLDVVYSAKDAGEVEFAAADITDPATAMRNYTFAMHTAGGTLLGASSVTIPLLGMGYVILSSFNITLDGATLAAILEGTITTWLDARITALNPGGLTDVEGDSLSDTTRTILLLQSPVSTSDPFTELMQMFDASYTGAAIRTATLYADHIVLQSAMQLRGASLSILPLAVELNPQIFHALFQRADGAVVQPSAEAVQACAAAADLVLDSKANVVRLSSSPDDDCYPLASTVYLTIRRSTCDATTDADGVATIAFFEWLFGSAGVDEAFLESGFSPLWDETEGEGLLWKRHLELAMGSITCQRTTTDSTDSTLLFIIIPTCCGAGLLVVGVLFGLWLWRFTAPMRRMRKMLSNDNVAEECVEAISRLDLAAVAWLRELPKPNRIQRAFVRIITLLEDIRPFIPDQLLATLAMKDKKEEAPENAEANAPLSMLGPEVLKKYNPAGPRRSGARVSSVTSSSREPSSLTRSSTGGSTDWRRGCKGPAPPSVPSEKHSSMSGTLPFQRTSDWTRRRCVYMYVQFGLDMPSLDEGTCMTWLGHVAAHIAGAGKAKAGTLDRVTFGTVILHWGATGSPVGGALSTVTLLALELAEMEIELPAELRPGFWIRIGIGAGICTVATLTAGGLRFFVLGSREVTTVTGLVTSAVATKFKGCVLLTSAAHAEVHYQVRCCPRVWFGDNLLWEPLGLQEKETHEDEWMYQLQELDAQGDKQATSHAMHGLFLMLHNGTRPEELRRAVDEFRDRHAEQLSVKDGACLSLLVASATPLSRTQSGRQTSSPMRMRP